MDDGAVAGVRCRNLRGKQPGELASMATYSFQNGKLMTAGPDLSFESPAEFTAFVHGRDGAVVVHGPGYRFAMGRVVENGRDSRASPC